MSQDCLTEICPLATPRLGEKLGIDASCEPVSLGTIGDSVGCVL
jgi:hypothetical protein